MDVINRLLPRHGTGTGSGFKRLKHSSQLGLEPVQSDNFFAIGGPSSGLDQLDDGNDQFALIPATDSAKVELALVASRQLQEKGKEKSTMAKEQEGKKNGTAGKMPWNREKNKEVSLSIGEPISDVKKGKSKNKQQRDASCAPKIDGNPPNGAMPPAKMVDGDDAGDGVRRRRTLLGSILPGGKKGKDRRMNPSISEPQLNILMRATQGGSPALSMNNNGAHFEEDNLGWEELEVGGSKGGDRHRLYAQGKKEEKEGEDGEGKGKNGKKKMPPMVGALKKVRGKLPGILGGGGGTNNNIASSSSGFSSDFSSTCSNSSSSSASSSSVRSTNGIAAGNGGMIGANGITNGGRKGIRQEGGAGKASGTPTLVKLRKQAKIMDIMGKKGIGDTEANEGGGNANHQQQCRKPIDAQHLLLFEESLATTD